MTYSDEAAWVALGLTAAVVGIGMYGRSGPLAVVVIGLGLYVATYALFSGLDRAIQRGRARPTDGAAPSETATDGGHRSTTAADGGAAGGSQSDTE